MKKIFSIILQDLLNAIRNNMLILSILGPIFLAIIIRLYLPSSDNVNLKFSVNSKAPESFVKKLSEFWDVEVKDSKEDIISRVNGIDDITGVIYQDSTYNILFEGDEIVEFKNGVKAVIENTISPIRRFHFDHKAVSENRFYNKEFFTVILVFSSIFLAGMVIGFNMVDDKESEIIRAVFITPVNFWNYICARCFSIAVLVFPMCVICVIIVCGFRLDWFKFLITLLLGVLIALTLTISIAAFAKNQIYAIGIVKFLLPVYFAVPFILEVFSPTAVWILYLFPNLWFYSMIQNVFMGADEVILPFWKSVGLFIVSCSLTHAM